MAKKEKNKQSNKFFQTMKNIRQRRKTDSSYDAFIKLVTGFAFIGILLILILIYGAPGSAKKNKTVPANSISYKTLINDRVVSGTKYDVNIEINNQKYKVTADIENNNIVGYLESYDGNSKFIIKDNELYIIKFEEEILTSDLNGIDINVINALKMVPLLGVHQSVKTVENNIVKYNYNIDINNTNYIIDSYIENKVLSKIEVKNDISRYIIEFK